MRDNDGKWMLCKRNQPSISDMCGVWEKQIRSARTILSSLLRTHGYSLNDESLWTFLIEVKALVNSRPLTTDLLSDANIAILLSPINLLSLSQK